MKLSETLLVDVIRGNLVESVHQCDCVVVNAAGETIMAWGEPDREMYARSSIKPVQALPLVESGAADHYNFSPAEVALSCASHNSEAVHVKAVKDVLGRIGLGETDLECGPHRPYDEASSDDMIREGVEPCRLHNNCSGKHMGFLTTTAHLGEDPKGYIKAEHGVQKRILEAMSETSDCDLSATARGTDGCGIPVVGMSLSGLARSMARMADPSGLGAVREVAAKRIVASMIAEPHMVAGRNRMDTLAMQAMGNVAFKAGAEGVMIAIVPERGLGIAVKARDGNSRACEVAALWIINKLDLISNSAAREIANLMEPDVKNRNDLIVGKICVHEGTA
ncbi:MAG: asparaginase [Rhodospirillales bacterium]|jgi:L-asparaginase II|nr:asparaginase [Rhodospirillales bacterium]